MSKGFFQNHDSKEYASDGKFFRFEPGENLVRILSTPIHMMTVFMGKGIAPQVVKSVSEVPNGKDGTHRFMCYVYNHKEEKIQIAEFPVSVVNALSDLAKGKTYGFKGELPPYDILIMKKGEGMETRYTVAAGRNEEEMPKEVLDELASLPTCEEIKDKKYKEQNPGAENNPNATKEEKEDKAAKDAEDVFNDPKKPTEKEIKNM